MAILQSDHHEICPCNVHPLIPHFIYTEQKKKRNNYIPLNSEQTMVRSEIIAFSSSALDILSTTRAYLCVIAAKHFLIDPQGIVKASMCDLFIFFNCPVSRL